MFIESIHLIANIPNFVVLELGMYPIPMLATHYTNSSVLDQILIH